MCEKEKNFGSERNVASEGFKRKTGKTPSNKRVDSFKMDSAKFVQRVVRKNLFLGREKTGGRRPNLWGSRGIRLNWWGPNRAVLGSRGSSRRGEFLMGQSEVRAAGGGVGRLWSPRLKDVG